MDNGMNNDQKNKKINVLLNLGIITLSLFLISMVGMIVYLFLFF